jgi:hypothetical protein
MAWVNRKKGNKPPSNGGHEVSGLRGPRQGPNLTPGRRRSLCGACHQRENEQSDSSEAG